MWCVFECDLETSTMRRLKHTTVFESLGKLDQIRRADSNWSESITTFDRNPSVFSDMQHVDERLVVCSHYIFLLSTTRRERINSVHNSNIPHKPDICVTVHR